MTDTKELIEFLDRKIRGNKKVAEEDWVCKDGAEMQIAFYKEIKEILEIYSRTEWKDFGYENWWSKDPDEIQKCKKLKHETVESSNDPPFRRHNWAVKCYICKIIYHYDSS